MVLRPGLDAVVAEQGELVTDGGTARSGRIGRAVTEAAPIGMVDDVVLVHLTAELADDIGHRAQAAGPLIA